MTTPDGGAFYGRVTVRDMSGLVLGEGVSMAIAEMSTTVPKGVVQSFESSAERRSNKKRGLRLTEPEIAELQDYWLGFAAEIGFRSVHGAVESMLNRRPPAKWTKRLILEFIVREGGRCPEAKLIKEMVESTKNVLEIGIQRFEVTDALAGPEGLVTKGVLERERIEKPDGEGTFVELRMAERGEIKIRTALRSVHTSLREVPMSAKERAWAAQDRELWLMWNEVPVHDQGGKHKGASFDADVGYPSKLGRSIAAALEAMTELGAVVLRAAYGTPPSPFGSAYGEGLGHVAAMTPAVKAERVAVAKRRAAARSQTTMPVPMCLINDAPIYVNDSLFRTRAQLEDWELRRIRPEDVLRDKLGDTLFRKRVEAEADAMLVKACAEYRKVRLRG